MNERSHQRCDHRS